MSKKKIEIKCKAADRLPIDAIIEFQGNLKKISPANLASLKTRILTDGFIVPLFVWDDAGDYKLLDGHQRIQALLSLRQEGYDIPLLPVAIIDARDEKEARARLLSITSQYGEFDTAILAQWLDDLDPGVAETLRLVDGEIALPSNDLSAFLGAHAPDEPSEPENIRMSFVFTAEQAEQITLAIQATKDMALADSPESALSYISEMFTSGVMQNAV